MCCQSMITQQFCCNYCLLILRCFEHSGSKQKLQCRQAAIFADNKTKQISTVVFIFSCDWLTDFLFPVIAEEEIEAVEEGVFDVHL